MRKAKKRPWNTSNAWLESAQIEGIFFRINYGIRTRRYWEHKQIYGYKLRRLVCTAKDKTKVDIITIKQILCIHTTRFLLKQQVKNHLSRVISSLWRGLRIRKVCVTRRPWMETSTRLFNRVYLECCLYVLCLHWLLPLVLIIVSLVLSYVRRMVWVVNATLKTCYMQHIHIYLIAITNTGTRAFI